MKSLGARRRTRLVLASCSMVLIAAPGASAQWLVNGPHVYYNAGNVGIGTGAPTSKLHVVTPLSANGTQAVHGAAIAATGVTNGLSGESRSDAGRGVFGFATSAAGASTGVMGQCASTAGRGVIGLVTATSGISYGVLGECRSNVPATGLPAVNSLPAGVFGRATSTTARAIGVLGRNSSPGGAGVAGFSTSTTGENSGVYGESRGPTTAGVTGFSLSASGFSFGIQGDSLSPVGAGVYGHGSATTTENYGVYGETDSLTNGWGVYSEGNLGASGMKLFHIDHPLDPANKYLNHYCAEGPEPLLIYRGNATLDGSGGAWVELPSYFEAINRDFHYHLTPIGAPGPLLHVAAEIAGNRFRIAGGTPGGKVSWTVTGVRSDAYAAVHGKPVEQDKPAGDKGKYLHPQLFGQPVEKRIHPRRTPAQGF